MPRLAAQYLYTRLRAPPLQRPRLFFADQAFRLIGLQLQYAGQLQDDIANDRAELWLLRREAGEKGRCPIRNRRGVDQSASELFRAAAVQLHTHQM